MDYVFWGSSVYRVHAYDFIDKLVYEIATDTVLRFDASVSKWRDETEKNIEKVLKKYTKDYSIEFDAAKYYYGELVFSLSISVWDSDEATGNNIYEDLGRVLEDVDWEDW